MRWLPLLLLFAGCATYSHRVAPHAASWPVHLVETEDGATIAMQRWRNPGKPAVVLCHGISSNHHFWDIDLQRSLAARLYLAGYDVWNLDLRGHGLAYRDTQGRRQPPTWNVDDYAMYDLPAAFEYIQQHNGTNSLHYVGHSLGGMVLAIHLATSNDSPLTSAVVVGSPLSFTAPDTLTRTLLKNARHLRFVRRWPTRAMARALLVMGRAAPLHANDMLYQRDNLTPRIRRRMLRRIVSPMVRGEVRQLAQVHGGTFLSADGEQIYADNLGEITLPMLFIAGRADHIATPDAVRAYYLAVGSPDKTWLMASRANGFQADYGHLDLGLGDAAPVDIHPKIEAFLRAHEPTP